MFLADIMSKKYYFNFLHFLQNWALSFPVLIRSFQHPDGAAGRLAQLVERHVYTVHVGGSSPSSPTIPCALSGL